MVKEGESGKGRRTPVRKETQGKDRASGKGREKCERKEKVGKNFFRVGSNY